ncbi:uncharacterized protein [Salminus brasiliensis]|uniref:uncharacterized protein n=1 Tax=Salminus brasiliensis TaxID=930266 RepID=UPI003B830643
MHHQNHYLSWSDRPICRHSWRRRRGGLGYDCCGQQENEEDSSASWMHDRPTVCYYTGDDDLTHEYVEIETDSCLTVAEEDFEEVLAGQELEDHAVWMAQSHQTEDSQEHIPGASCPPTSHRTNEGSDQAEGGLCPCRTVHSRWRNEATNQCLCVPPQCFNVRNTLVVGVEVDVLEELIYEDTEIVQTQTVFDGSLENHPMDPPSYCCNQLFLQ